MGVDMSQLGQEKGGALGTPIDVPTRKHFWARARTLMQ